MCLVFIAFECHKDYRFVVAANRDEFYARPTEAATFWTDRPTVLAGRDLEAGGTWLGIERGGRFAALTNFRNPTRQRTAPPSRGALVTNFLTGQASAVQYTSELRDSAEHYNGFGLLVLDNSELAYCSNGVKPVQRTLEPGLYGLSNHLLDTPWPKVVHGKQGVQRCLERGADINELFEVMTNRRCYTDDGVAGRDLRPEFERNFSAAFVETEHYGTRSTTVLTMSRAGQVEFYERTYRRDNTRYTSQEFRFNTADKGYVEQRPQRV